MAVQRRLRQVHKIVGIIVGIQVLCWMVSGLYMTAVPIEFVRGEHVTALPASQTLPASEIYDINTLIAEHPRAQSVTLTRRLGQPAYQVLKNDEPLWLDAFTAKPLALLSADEAKQWVQQHYQGEHAIDSVVAIIQREQAPETGSRRLPLWQVNMTDWLATSVYVSATSGEIVAVRSNVWRWFDFVWMLHIMDYESRSNFNNPLVIFMASLGLLLTLSGILVVTNGVRRKGWRALWR